MAIPETARFFHQFATLLNSGFSVQQSLALAGKDCSAAFQRALQQVSTTIGKGQDLAFALSQHPRQFDHWTVSLIQTAEASGALAPTCEGIAIAQERQQKWRRLYRSAIWSVLMLTVSLLLLGLVLSGNTSLLVQPVFWIVLLGIAGWLALDIANTQRFVTQFGQPGLLGLPVVGPILQAQSILYLCELQLPLSCGVPLLTALDLVRHHMPDRVMASHLAIATQQVRAGNPLNEGLKGKLPPLATQMIRTGEETGSLDTMLQKLAEHYTGELERSLRQLQSVLRPLNILAFGSLVALLGVKAIASLINALPG